MPHLIVEHSENIGPAIRERALLSRLHRVVVESGVFAVEAVRTRSAPRVEYHIATGEEEFAFLHIVLRIREGRDQAIRKKVGEAIFNEACDAMKGAPSTEALAISMEVQEIDPELSWRANGVRTYIEDRVQ